MSNSNFAGTIRWDLLRYINGQGLDLGCGDARPHDWMVGIDTVPGKTGKGPNMILDARSLSMFADKTQDFVFSSYLLNELEDWEGALKEWWRVIKDDGYLILFLPVTAEDAEKSCYPKKVVDAMVQNRPWQFVEARMNGDQMFHVYRKCNLPTVLKTPEEMAAMKICAVVKLGAHGDALWASSVLPGLKEQGFHVIMFTQSTGEEVLRHDPNIDELVCFESRVPLEEIGEFFQWLDQKYDDCRVLVECCEGLLLPSPQKVQYHWPLDARHKTMNMNYLDMHHLVAGVPVTPHRMCFYPNEEEMAWANEFRATLNEKVVVLVPNGSSVTKNWPYMPEFAAQLCENENLSVVVLGDIREAKYAPHPNLHVIALQWDVRKAFTFAKLADVVVGQETGLLNCVGMIPEVHKVVLMSHSSRENLTRDWPNTDTIRTLPECAGKSGCHRLHWDFVHCKQDEVTKVAKCQAMITVDMVMEKVMPYIVSCETERIEETA